MKVARARAALVACAFCVCFVLPAGVALARPGAGAAPPTAARSMEPRGDARPCTICGIAHRHGLRLVAHEPPLITRCSPMRPPVHAAAPFCTVRARALDRMEIRFHVREEVEAETARLRFWDARGLCYEHEVEARFLHTRLPAHRLPGWAEAMRKSVGDVTWTWDVPGARSPRGRFRIRRMPIAYDEELKALSGKLRDASPLVVQLLRAKWFLDHDFVQAASEELAQLSRRDAHEPHVLAMQHRILRMRGLAQNLIGAPELVDALRALDRAHRRGHYEDCDVGGPIEPYKSGATQAGCR